MSLCGDLADGHTFRNCKQCKRISKAMERGATLEEAQKEKQQPTCHSCRVRFAVSDLATREHYNPIDLTSQQVKWIENAARVFELYRWRWTPGKDPECHHRPNLSGECVHKCGAVGVKLPQEFTAPDFVAWLKPDVVGMVRREIDPELLRPKPDRAA